MHVERRSRRRTVISMRACSMSPAIMPANIGWPRSHCSHCSPKKKTERNDDSDELSDSPEAREVVHPVFGLEAAWVFGAQAVVGAECQDLCGVAHAIHRHRS